MSLEHLTVERCEDAVLLVTLNRPHAANAINTQMGRELQALFGGLAAAQDGCRAVVLTGAGRCFCSGGDLKERNDMSEPEWAAQHNVFERMIESLIDCPVPVIAAINGAAYAGGCEIALACDFVYASETARFALTEVTLGFMPGCGGTQLLPRALGERRAKEILLTGRTFSAGDAYEWGLVNRVCTAEELVQVAVSTARMIAENAPLAVQHLKRVIHQGLQRDLRAGMALELSAYRQLIPTDDRQEGVRAFNEKRRPRFTGR